LFDRYRLSVRVGAIILNGAHSF